MIADPIEAFGHHGPVTPPGGLPPIATPDIQEAGAAGHRTLWVVFVIMLIATIAFIGMSFSVPINKRLYHVVTTFIVLTATLSYFAMASGDGISWKRIKLPRHTKHQIHYHYVEREVYWARYVDWVITTPLLLLDLGLLAGLGGGSLFIAIVADVIMVLTGLFAAFGENGTRKWGWYAFGCVAYLVIVWQLVVNGRASVQAKGGKVRAFYIAIGGFTLVLWTIYPIVWGFADGARRATVDAEIIAYGVLDVLAKPVFGLWLLLTHVNLPEASVDLHGFWTHGFSSEGAIRVGDDDGA